MCQALFSSFATALLEQDSLNSLWCWGTQATAASSEDAALLGQALAPPPPPASHHCCDV